MRDDGGDRADRGSRRGGDRAVDDPRRGGWAKAPPLRCPAWAVGGILPRCGIIGMMARTDRHRAAIIAHRSPQHRKRPQVPRSVGRFIRGGFQPTRSVVDHRPPDPRRVVDHRPHDPRRVVDHRPRDPRPVVIREPSWTIIRPIGPYDGPYHAPRASTPRSHASRPRTRPSRSSGRPSWSMTCSSLSGGRPSQPKHRPSLSISRSSWSLGYPSLRRTAPRP
jgi:hypothetical protein